jgi:hypothetical protein
LATSCRANCKTMPRFAPVMTTVFPVMAAILLPKWLYPGAISGLVRRKFR